MDDYEAEEQAEKRRDARIQKKLKPYDDEIDDLDNQIAETKDLQRAVGEKLATLEARRSDLQMQRAEQHSELNITLDDFPTIARIADLGR